MKKLFLFLVVVVVGAAVAVELVAPRLVAARIEERTRAETAGRVEVEAEVDSFPFVTRLVATGRVERITIALDEVADDELPLASVRFVAVDVDLDRRALLDRDVRVRGVERVTVTATVTSAALEEAAGGAVDLAEVEAAEGALVLAGASVPLPQDLLQCTPVIETTGTGLRLSCTMRRLPPLLERVLPAPG